MLAKKFKVATTLLGWKYPGSHLGLRQQVRGKGAIVSAT